MNNPIATISQNTVRFWISNIVLFVGIGAVCFPVMANEVTSVASPDTGLVAMIGAATHESIEKMQSGNPSNLKTQMLMNLATAEITAGDLKDAQAVLAEVRSTAGLPDYFISDLFVLSVRAGDMDGAIQFIQKNSSVVQMGALGQLAEVQIRGSDTADADKTIGLIEGLYANTPPEPAAQTADPSRRQNFQDSYDNVLGSIAKNYAARGDITHATAIAGKISNKGTLSGVLAEIAKAQHKSGDQRAADETLQRLKQNVDTFYAKDPVQVAIIESMAFGPAGETDKAQDIIAALPLKQSRDLAYSRLSEALARNGDTIHARQIADITGDPDDLILVGKEQHNAGNDPDAHNTFLAAHEALKKQDSMNKYDKFGKISQIVEGLISVGAFSDAISISAELDDLNRPQHIVSAVREEIKRGDAQAIKETAPTALKIAEEGTLFNENDLAKLAIVLSKAGLTDNAKTVLAITQKNADHLSGWQRMDALNSIKEAEIALGDMDGAAKTAQAIQQETAKFNNQVAIQTNESGGNAAEAVKLIQQAQTSDDPQTKKGLIQRALALVDNNAQKLEALIFIAARFSPGLQKLKDVDADIAHHDFANAMTTINSLTGSERDAGLERLAQAQAEAGQLKPAFDTANAMGDPSNRTSALIGIISANSNKANGAP